MGRIRATAAAELFAAAAEPGAFVARVFALGTSWENGHVSPRLQVPFGKNRQGTVAFGVCVLPLPLPSPLASLPLPPPDALGFPVGFFGFPVFPFPLSPFPLPSLPLAPLPSFLGLGGGAGLAGVGGSALGVPSFLGAGLPFTLGLMSASGMEASFASSRSSSNSSTSCARNQLVATWVRIFHFVCCSRQQSTMFEFGI